MEELLRTSDAVLVSYVESLLRDAEIRFLVLDQNMSVMQGHIGLFPRRVLVDSDTVDHARRILTENGLAGELRDAPHA